MVFMSFRQHFLIERPINAFFPLPKRAKDRLNGLVDLFFVLIGQKYLQKGHSRF